MDVFSVITLFGGLAFFLYGMHVMSSGLEKSAGGKLEKILGKITGSRWRSLIFGAVITIAIQSSSALTVMLVGLVNSGIVQFSQTVGIIMGSNVGTTLTAWLLSLTGIESDNLFIQLLKPENFAPIFALIGIVLIMMSKRNKYRDIGQVLVGFAILMYGMTMMSGAVKPLADIPEFQHLLVAFKNPILGVLVGALFTGLIQSSAASIGILQALSLTGTISYGMAIPIIMGQNIGTCVTSAISSIGVNKNAKKVAVVHIMFNVIGTVIFLVLYYIAKAFISNELFENAASPIGIAIAHSAFNVLTTIILFPFSKLLIKLTELLVGNKKVIEKDAPLIDQRLLNTPSIAITECERITATMARTAQTAFADSLKIVDLYNEKSCNALLEKEDKLDMYEDKLGTVLVNISSKTLSLYDSRRVSKLLHTIGDFERIGDHAVNMSQVAKEMYEKSISFSDEATSELVVLRQAITDILDMTMEAFETGDLALASHVEPLEQVIDRLISDIKANHITRLQNGNCTIELGFILSDYLTNCERVSDHCSNVAVAVIEVTQNTFDTHEYLGGIKSMANREFKEMFDEYYSKYSLQKK